MALKYIYNPETGQWIPQWDYSDGSERYQWVPNYGETSPAYNVDRGYVVKPIPGKTEILIDRATNSPVPYKQSVKVINNGNVEALRSLPEVEVIANRPRNIPSDYDALLGETRANNNRIAWQRNPNLMQEYKAAGDAVGLAAISLALPGKRALHPLIRWGIPALTTAYAGYNIYDNYAGGTEPLYLDEEASAESASVTPEAPADSNSGASSASAQPEPPKNDNENKNKEQGDEPKKRGFLRRTFAWEANPLPFKKGWSLGKAARNAGRAFILYPTTGTIGLTGAGSIVDLGFNAYNEATEPDSTDYTWKWKATKAGASPFQLPLGILEAINESVYLDDNQASNNQSPSQSTNYNTNQGSNQNTNNQTEAQPADSINVLNKIRSMMNGNQNQQ